MTVPSVHAAVTAPRGPVHLLRTYVFLASAGVLARHFTFLAVLLVMPVFFGTSGSLTC